MRWLVVMLLLLSLLPMACQEQKSSLNDSTDASSLPLSENSKKPFLDQTDTYLFSPEQSQESIQAKIDELYAELYGYDTGHFSKRRVAFLFLPGTYGRPDRPLDIKVGYYTQVLGLGAMPKDVVINGFVRAENNVAGKGTDNFWRAVENLSIVPPKGKPNKWIVSQAAPIRRVLIEGALKLSDSDGVPGWTSGGFMASTKVNGDIGSGTQQQWFTRNSTWNNWPDKNWFLVFLNTEGSVKDASEQYSTTAAMREKPFMIAEKEQDDYRYSIVVPSLKKDGQKSGANEKIWRDELESGRKIGLNDVVVIGQQTKDPTASIKNGLKNGKHILLLPGIYEINEPLKVTRSGTVILGLGLATLMPAEKGTWPNDSSLLEVSDEADDVTIAGLMLEARATDLLLRIGELGSKKDHQSAPTVIYDLYARIGGRDREAWVKTAVEINSKNVIGDNFWLWRADHDTKGQTAFTDNPADHGLVVNGDAVSLYGLAVEHFMKVQTKWEGNFGSVYFYQSETPYFANGRAIAPSYQVGKNVTNHNAYGLGIYLFLNKEVVTNPELAISVLASDEAIQKGISFVDIQTFQGTNIAGSGFKKIIGSEVAGTKYPPVGKEVARGGTDHISRWPAKP